MNCPEYKERAEKWLFKSNVWFIEIDGQKVKLPTKKAGWVSIGAAKSALRNSLSGKGEGYEEFLTKHVKFKKV